MARAEPRSPRTTLVALVSAAALVLSALAMAMAPPAHADEVDADDVTPDEVRTAGGDRYETAADAARAAFDADDVDDLLLANGESFADALSGAALAGAVEGPVLLTETDSLSGEAAEAITDLDPETVHLIGGEAVISEEAADEVEALDVAINRLSGADRYETAAAVAEAIVSDDVGGEIGEVDGDATVILASGETFPDAVAAGPGAYAGTHPILLTESDELPEATADALDELDPDQVLALGGDAVLGEGVFDDLGDEYPALRVFGEDRNATAAVLAEFFIDSLGFDPANVGLATGADAFGGADALASAPYLGEAQAPLLLTGSLPEPTERFLAERAADVGTLHVFGGDAVVDDDTVQQAQTAVSNPTYDVELSWINEVDDEGDEPEFFVGIPDGTGEAELTMNRAEGTIDYDISTDVDDDFDEAPGAHLHAGGLEENGPIVVFFADGPELDEADGQIEGTVSEDDFEDEFEDLTVEDIVSDLEEYYPNIHSNAFPMPGAVRGQLPFGGQDLIAQRDATFDIELSTDNQVVDDGFGVDSEAEGTAELTFRPLTNEIEYDISVDLPEDDGFEEGPGVHLHAGRIDANGPIVVFFADGPELEENDGEVSGTVSGNEFEDEFADLSVFDILFDPSNYYVNAHSNEFQPGVVRGQLPDGGADRIDGDDANGGGITY